MLYEVITRALNEPGDEFYDTIPDTRNAFAQYLELYSMSGDPDDFEDLVDFDYTNAVMQIVITSYSIHYTKLYDDLTLKNIEFLLKKNQVYEIRTVIIPDIMNNEETVSEISKLIVRYNPQIRYKLIKYRKIGVKNPYFSEEPTTMLMKNLKNIAENNGCLNVILV